jgi:cytochrome c peroxidase
MILVATRPQPFVIVVLVVVVVGGEGDVTGADPKPRAIPADTLPADLARRKPPAGLKLGPVSDLVGQRAIDRVALGRRLFFDRVLSRDRSLACASCHDPAHGFADPRPLSIGIGRALGQRNAPSLFNVALGQLFFWDGRASSLEDQVRFPIENPRELGSKFTEVVARLKADPEYVSAFGRTFPDGVTADNVSRSIADFERTLLLGNSRVDQFRAGKADVLTDAQRQGLWLYESRGRCWRCHSGANFTDERFHNTGVGSKRANPDVGRMSVSRRGSDRGRFKTPTLRGVGRTAPYMHDGSVKTLKEVVEFYNRGGVKNPQLDPLMRPLKLDNKEVGFLVEFLKALDGQWP